MEKQKIGISNAGANYAYLKHKFQLQNENVISPKFFRLRLPSLRRCVWYNLRCFILSKKTCFQNNCCTKCE